MRLPLSPRMEDFPMDIPLRSLLHSGAALQAPAARRKGNPRPVALRTDSTRFPVQMARLRPQIPEPELAADDAALSGKYCGFYREALSHEDKVAMYARAANLPSLLVTWILVADGQKAQIYECRKAERPKGTETGSRCYYDEQSGRMLAPAPDGFIKAESALDCRVAPPGNGADSPGDYIRNTSELRRLIQEELHRQFLRAIAARLQQAYALSSFDRLVFSMPADMIPQLKEWLSFDVQDCIVAAHGY